MSNVSAQDGGDLQDQQEGGMLTDYNLIFTSSQSSRPSIVVMVKILDTLDRAWSITLGPESGQI